MAKTFEKAQIEVTLSGEQWFALIAQAAGKPLSPEGRKIARQAGLLLASQVGAASDRIAEDNRIEAERERNFPFSGSF